MHRVPDAVALPTTESHSLALSFDMFVLSAQVPFQVQGRCSEQADQPCPRRLTF